MSGPKKTFGSIIFPVDPDALWKDRSLALREGSPRLPPDPVYDAARTFLKSHPSGYPFRLITVLHAAGVKMLNLRTATNINKTMFATGGLYLALDLNHPSLAIRDTFGDFTAGFVHQFGVAMAVMVTSQAYRIAWDRLEPIRVSGRKTLDYQGPIPGGRGLVFMEAKGATSANSQRSAKNAVLGKKASQIAEAQGAQSAAATLPAAMLGIITRAGRSPADPAGIEIIDPDFEYHREVTDLGAQLSARDRHYAKASLFAGLRSAADFLRLRAQGGRASRGLVQSVQFAGDSVIDRLEHRIVGIRWRLGSKSDDLPDIWFYHGMATDRLTEILMTQDATEGQPYSEEWVERFSFSTPEIVESLLPDGSYFAISIGSSVGLREVDPGQREFPTDLVGLFFAKR